MLLSAETFQLTAARPEDFSVLSALLGKNELPASDLTPEVLANFILAWDARGLAGSAGLEIYGGVALVRSLCTRADIRRQGLGAFLLAALTDLAIKKNIGQMFLLTTTAADFFSRYGFTPADRAAAPESIRLTTQFTDLCPATAGFMSKSVGNSAAQKETETL